MYLAALSVSSSRVLPSQNPEQPEDRRPARGQPDELDDVEAPFPALLDTNDWGRPVLASAADACPPHVAPQQIAINRAYSGDLRTSACAASQNRRQAIDQDRLSQNWIMSGGRAMAGVMARRKP